MPLIPAPFFRSTSHTDRNRAADAAPDSTLSPAAPPPPAGARVAAAGGAAFDRQLGSARPPVDAASAGAMTPLALRLATAAPLPSHYSLPERLPLAAATIHRYDDPRVTPSTIAVTIWAPLASADNQARVQNLNAAAAHEPLPDRFVVTDAGLTRCFIGIDKRPGTALDQKLEELVAKMPRNPHGEVEPEAAVEWVRAHVNQVIRWTRGSAANDGRAEFAWDKAIDVPDAVWDVFHNVAYEPVGHAPKSTSVEYPVVPFERYLEAGEGYCIQKALLAALLLDKVGVPSKLVNGAVAQGPGRSVGHTWVELGDGRVLDAAWSQIQHKKAGDPRFPDRFRFGSSERFANQSFPYLVFPDA